jgi:hypothetical protein
MAYCSNRIYNHQIKKKSTLENPKKHIMEHGVFEKFLSLRDKFEKQEGNPRCEVTYLF